MAKKNKSQGELLVCRNPKATKTHDIEERLEAGMVLKGSEVKSLRQRRADLDGSYATIDKGEVWPGSFCAFAGCAWTAEEVSEEALLQHLKDEHLKDLEPIETFHLTKPVRGLTVLNDRLLLLSTNEKNPNTAYSPPYPDARKK